MDGEELSRERLLPTWLWMLAGLSAVIVGFAIYHATVMGREKQQQVRVTAVERTPIERSQPRYPEYGAHPGFTTGANDWVSWYDETSKSEPEQTAVKVEPPPEKEAPKEAAKPAEKKKGVPDELRGAIPGRIIPPKPVIAKEEPKTPVVEYGGRNWKQAEAPPVTSDQVELESVGTAEDGKEIYGLRGQDEDQKVVFKETEPGSDEYSIYRPDG